MPDLWTVAPEGEEILGQAFPFEDPQALYDGAEPFPGGRGTTRRLRWGGRAFLFKRESRGGLAGRLLPDLYLGKAAFRAEWEAQRHAAAAGLSRPLAARAFVRKGLFFAVYTLSEEMVGSRSLAEVLAQGGLTAELLRRSGKAVAALHRTGLVHGDLNAGNLLLLPEGRFVFIDFRHSRVFPGLPPVRCRRRNVRRLLRSLRKVSRRVGRPLPPGAAGSLAGGYAEGWGGGEPWLRALVEEG